MSKLINGNPVKNKSASGKPTNSKSINVKPVNKIVTLLLLVAIIASSSCIAFAAESTYVHNPVYNAIAMEDIIVNPKAVYGFSPNPDSARLGSYANADWTDPESVEIWRQERIAYHNQFSTMYDKWQEMAADGESIETIARTVSAMRNEIRIASYKDNPEGLKALKESNLKKYGNENGPTPEYVYEKYGSWEKVLMKSFSENPGMDACLGLYDEYYESYVLLEEIEEVTFYTYTVKKGDCLSSIALKYFGNASRWRNIYQNNKNLIKNPNLIYVGQLLTIQLN